MKNKLKMTKVISIWKRFSFWTKVQGISATLGIGSEFALYLGDSHHGWKIFVGAISAIGVLLKYVIEDKNNNNVVDILE